MANRDSKNKWDKDHPQVIKKAKAKYDMKNPIWSFRPSLELRDWLEEQRMDSEGNAHLLTRKLSELMSLKQQK